MKSLLGSAPRVIGLVLALHVTSIPVRGQVQQVSLPTRVGQTKLPKDPLVKDATIGAASEAAGLPLADLVVKDAYLDEYAGMQGVNFLIANTGQQDAGPFEVSIRFIYPGASIVDARSDIYKVDGLKIGESKWVSASPICCGWAPTEFVVNGSDRFEVVADPKYSKTDPLDPYNPTRMIEVKSRIAESNKANNRLVIAKADMRHGVYSGTLTRSPAPVIGTIKMQTPVTKH